MTRILLALLMAFSAASAQDANKTRRWSLTTQRLDFSTNPQTGHQTDAYGWYIWNKNISVGAGFSHLSPGSFRNALAQPCLDPRPHFAITFKLGRLRLKAD